MILIINNGSTSFRFKLFRLSDYSILATGAIERLFINDCYIKYKTASCDIKKNITIKNYDDAIEVMSKLLLDENIGVIKK